jgi:hypothetical protein
MTKLAESEFNVCLHIFYLYLMNRGFIWQMSKVQLMHWKVESSKKSLSPTTSIDFSNLCLPYIHHFPFYTLYMNTALLDVKAMNETHKRGGWLDIHFLLHSGNKRRKNMHWKFSNGISILPSLPFCAKKDFFSCKLFSSWENRQRNVTKWNFLKIRDFKLINNIYVLNKSYQKWQTFKANCVFLLKLLISSVY